MRSLRTGRKKIWASAKQKNSEREAIGGVRAHREPVRRLAYAILELLEKTAPVKTWLHAYKALIDFTKNKVAYTKAKNKVILLSISIIMI